jgi:hypothetical protein
LLLGEGCRIKVDVERLDLAISHFEDFGHMALEGRATRWLKPISGQHASPVSLNQDARDVEGVDHGVEALGCLKIRAFTRYALDRVVKLVNSISSARKSSQDPFCLRESK